MQCNFLGTKIIGGLSGATLHIYPDKCATGTSDYETTEEDRNTYCENEKFTECPRYKTIVSLNETFNLRLFLNLLCNF
jgi:hypothetical protein